MFGSKQQCLVGKGMRVFWVLSCRIGRMHAPRQGNATVKDRASFPSLVAMSAQLRNDCTFCEKRATTVALWPRLWVIDACRSCHVGAEGHVDHFRTTPCQERDKENTSDHSREVNTSIHIEPNPPKTFPACYVLGRWSWGHAPGKESVIQYSR